MSDVLIPSPSTNACSQMHTETPLKISALNIPYILCMIALQIAPRSHVLGGVQLCATGMSCITQNYIVPGLIKHMRSNVTGARRVKCLSANINISLL